MVGSERNEGLDLHRDGIIKSFFPTADDIQVIDLA